MGAVLALVLVLFNGTVPTWEGLVILALMFLGTAVHRAERAQISARSAALAAAAVIVCALACAIAFSDSGFNRRGWTVAFALAVLTFAAGLCVRHRRLPCWLTAPGTISYSVYLLHPVLLSVVHASSERPEHDSPLLELGFLAVLLSLSALTHRYIEAPGQAWGRRLARLAGSVRGAGRIRGGGATGERAPPFRVPAVDWCHARLGGRTPHRAVAA